MCWVPRGQVMVFIVCHWENRARATDSLRMSLVHLQGISVNADEFKFLLSYRMSNGNIAVGVGVVPREHSRVIPCE